MAEECKYLPEECWELIFNRLPDDTYYEPLSLVCKQFLSVTNRLRFKFSVTDREILVDGNISKLLNRFPRLNSLDFSCVDDSSIDIVVLDKAYSCLFNLEQIDFSNKNRIPIRDLKKLGMNNRCLRVLKCSRLGDLRDSDLVAIANSLPLLEALDISYPRNCSFHFWEDYYYNLPFGQMPVTDADVDKMRVTDAGIKVLAMNLKSLRRINISGQDFISVESLVCLSMNCRYLEGIEVMCCGMFKSYGILSLLRNSSNLSSISVFGIDDSGDTNSLVFEEDSGSYGQCLERLEISYSVDSVQFFYLLAKANLPLKRLSLIDCGITLFSALSSLLCSCQSLEFLALGSFDFLTDESFRDLSPYLHNLVAIKLYDCPNFTISTFYILAKSCPLLQAIEMRHTNLGKETSTATSIVDCMNKYMNIKSLNFPDNNYLDDECLKRIASVCPNLEKIGVSLCSSITQEGIADVLDMCPEIRSLEFDHCSFGIEETIREGSELPNLEELYIKYSAINDRGLAAIGKRCPGLLKLDLQSCTGVTTRGVEEVLRHCKSLTEINLTYCTHVDLNSLDWTVLSRPSLKKVFVSWHYLITEEKQKSFSAPWISSL